jgi:hypothetical protein
MKRAINLFMGLGAFGLLISIMSCGMGRQLRWNSAEAMGVYAFAASVTSLFIAAMLQGIDWIRKNIRIQ